MTDKRRVYYKTGGEVMVVVPDSKSRKGTETEQQWLGRVYAKAEKESQTQVNNIRFDLLFEQQKSVPDVIRVAMLAALLLKHENSNLKGKDFEDKTVADFPAEYNSNTHEKLRGGMGQPFVIDNTIKTATEKRQKVIDDLDTELVKPNPDLKTVMQLQLKLNKQDYN